LITAPATAADPLAVLEAVRPKLRLEAPDFDAADLHGNDHRLHDYRGRLVLLHFWATYCAPCREELPALETLWQRYRGTGLAVISVSLDEDTRGLARFARRLGLSFPVLKDNAEGSLRRTYEVFALPTTYLIGRNGKFLGRITGARDWDTPAARAAVEALLGPGAGNRQTR